MKAISLWNPWAALIRCKAKTIESRSWPTNYRGPIAIHAAKKILTSEEYGALGSEFWSACYAGGLDQQYPSLPRGRIVATARLVACVSTNTVLYRPRIHRERMFGDYSQNRFAWILEDIVALKTPIPCRGMQGLFEVPDELLKETA